MALTFDQFFQAIAEQESGGNYSARGVYVRGDRAYGKYQVMGANIPSWTKKHWGTALTPEQFLNNPKAQEAVARGTLQGYWNKYGARGAASAWYSGDPNLHSSTRSQSGGPSIKGYVDSVLAKAAKYSPGGGGSTGGGSTAPSGAGASPLSRSEAAENYGFVEAMMNAVPELKKMFDRAVKESWTSSKFQAEVRNTKWFKTHSETERQFLIKQYGDPATADQMWNTARTKIWQMGSKVGSGLTWADVNRLAYNVMAKGWSDEQVRHELAKDFRIREGDVGEAGQVVAQLREYAYQMGVPTKESWLQDAARKVVGSGEMVDSYKSYIRDLAKGLYSNWAKQITGGQTVIELASPYMQSMASILELPPGSITLNDRSIKNALQSKDKLTGQNRIKPIWEFENELRNDPRWKQTKNAQDSTMQVAHQVLADFGMAY